MEEQVFKGSNGVSIMDGGDDWVAIGSPNVTTPQEIDYLDRNDRPTGVRYGIGFDKVAGATKIAYVKYPKEFHTLEDVMNSPETPRIIMRCNVCHAMDETAKLRGVHPFESVPASPAQQQFLPQQLPPPVAARAPSYQGLPPTRISPMPSGVQISKYIPFILNLAKNLTLSPLGDAVVSTAASIAFDAVGAASSDPNYKAAMQSLSDTAIDSIANGNPTPEFFNAVKEDAVTILDAMRTDGKRVEAIKKGLFKDKDKLISEIRSSKSVASSPSSPPESYYSPPSPTNGRRGDLPSLRLFE